MNNLCIRGKKYPLSNVRMFEKNSTSKLIFLLRSKKKYIRSGRFSLLSENINFEVEFFSSKFFRAFSKNIEIFLNSKIATMLMYCTLKLLLK